MRMLTNYHTHTPRCHHTEGSEREMIEAALGIGYRVLGFSDHAPQPFGKDYTSNVRMTAEELPEYVKTLTDLREQYRGQIEIHIGLEAEYYPALFDGMLALAREHHIEYLILGQHWLNNEVGEIHIAKPFDDAKRLAHYVDQTIEGMQTGVFSYVAHPDLPRFTGKDTIYIAEMRRLIRAAAEKGMPLEINLLGISRGRHYPNPLFWKLVAEEGAEVILGKDAHSPKAFFETHAVQTAKELVTQFGLKLTDTPILRKP